MEQQFIEIMTEENHFLMFTNKGLTNLEWLITIFLIFSVTFLGISLSEKLQYKTDIQKLEQDMKKLDQAIEKFRTSKKRLPYDLKELVNARLVDSVPICPFTKQQYWYTSFSYPIQTKDNKPLEYYCLSTPYNIIPDVYQLRIIYISWLKKDNKKFEKIEREKTL